MIKLRNTLKDWSRNNSGNFGMIAALLAVPIIVASGGVMELQGAQRSFRSVQNAADVASLSAAKLSGTYAEKKAQADLLFQSNLPKDIDIVSVDLKIDGGKHTYLADVAVDTTFLRLINVNEFETRISAIAENASTPIDVVMTLDSSGSMSIDGRMTELKKAVSLFMDELGGTGSVQAAIVPFDTQVRVQNALFPNGYSAAAGNPYASTTNCSLLSDPDDKAACLAAQAAGPAKADCSFITNSTDRSRCTGSATGFTVGTNRCYSSLLSATTYWAFEYNGYLKVRKSTGIGLGCLINLDPIGLLTGGTEIYSRPMPAGARSTVFAKDNSVQTSNNDLLLNNVNNIVSWSGCFVDRTREYDVSAAPVNLTVKETIYPQASCAVDTLKPIRDLTTDLSAVKAAAQALTPSGNTNVTIGVQWGLEVLSPQAPFTNGRTTEGVRKVMVVLTDGLNTQNRWWGSADAPKIDARTLLACQNAKQAGVEVFAINLIGGSEAILKSCASDAAHYFAVTSASELTKTFRSIAASLKKIRLVG